MLAGAVGGSLVDTHFAVIAWLDRAIQAMTAKG
jgi:hypothetical protein